MMNYIKNIILKNNLFLITLMSLFICFSFAFANIVWPGLYIAAGIIKYYVIIINFIISIILAKIIAKDASNIKLILVSIIMMLLLSLAGTIVIPICGLVGELIFSVFNIRTFGLISWLINYISAVAFYSLLDSIIFKITFKLKIKSTYLKLFGYNMITIGLAIIEILVIHPNQIMF